MEKDSGRALKAFAALKALGIPKETVKPVLLDLLEVFNWNWELIEAEDYRALIDRYFELKENQGEEDKNKHIVGNAKSERPSKRLDLGLRKDHVSSATFTSGQGSNQHSQPCLMDRTGSSSSIPNSPLNYNRKDLTSSHLNLREKKSTQNRELQTVYLKHPLNADDALHILRENVPSSHCNRESIKPKIDQPISDMACPSEPILVVRPGPSVGSSTEDHFVKPLASEHLHIDNGDDASGCNDSVSSKNNFGIATTAMGEVKMSLNCTHALERLQFQRPNFDAVLKYLECKYLMSGKVLGREFSVKKLLNDLCDAYLELGCKCISGSAVINSPSESVVYVGSSLSDSRARKQASRIGNSERDLNKTGSNLSGCLNSSKIVNIQQQLVTCNKKRPPFSISDITKGAENVPISLVDETGNEDLPKFTYIPHNIIFQNAYLHISLARIADEDCCSNCSGDCLSLSIPCACARETGGEFAYTQQGLLKEEFLNACISMKKEPCEQHLVYCQDCPLERSKNEFYPEKCKGHIVRKFIKECWRKCGCSMQCQNRVVQRGITCKLQVFLTHGGKGWGLRTLQDLPKGAFVCEYVGEIVTNTELDERNMQCSGSERHTYPVTLDADWGSEKILRDEEALCLDATFCGNVARFINHRCVDATLIDIPVEVETPDRHYYHLAFFTTRKVSAFEELSWDYGIDFSDHDHPIKAFQCCCGSAFCRDVKKKSKRRCNKGPVGARYKSW